MNNLPRAFTSIKKTIRCERFYWPIALIALTALAMTMRWYYASTAVVLDPIRGDAAQYYSYAFNLANHAVFSKQPLGSPSITPDSYRDPGYPVFLAAWMIILGSGDAWYAAVLLTQAVLGALTVTLATQLGKYWLPSSWAFFAGLLMAIWPHCITINGYLLSETLFSFLVASGVFLCMAGCHRKSFSVAAHGGVLLGAASLTNTILLPFGMILAIFLFWRKYIEKKIFISIVISVLIFPLLWSVRNSQIPPAADFSSSTDRALINLAQGAWPGYHSAWRASFFGDAAEKASAKVVSDGYEREFDELKKSPIHGLGLIIGRMDDDPWHYAYWYLLEKPHLLWDWDIRIGQGDIYVYPTRNSPFDSNACWIAVYALCHAVNLLMTLLSLASVFFAWSRKSPFFTIRPAPFARGALASVICLISFVTVVYTVLQAEPRYSIPFRPFEMLLATTTLCGSYRLWKRRRESTRRQQAGGIEPD